MENSNVLVRIQQVSVLYLCVWTISPFMEIDLFWRIGSLMAFGLWMICAMSRGLHFEKIHMLALAFLALIVVVNIVENNGFSKILRPIQNYMLVLFFIVGHFYKDKWKELYFIVPIILLLLIYFNFKSAFTVMEDATIARRLVRNDEDMYIYLRQGIGGYSLIYPQVVTFPVLVMWLFKSYRQKKLFFLIGIVWLVSYVLFVINANYSIAITGSVISLIILLFYKGHSVGLAFAVSAGLFIALMLMILNVEGFRNMLLEFFDGTAVAKKINDPVATSESGAAEGSINDMRVMQGAPERKTGEDGLPLPPYAVYNIGNSNPENLLDFVDVLQQELVRAEALPADYNFEEHKKLVPMQPGDVPVTYSDTSALERDFGFKPATSLREGLRKFAEWYKEFYQV